MSFFSLAFLLGFLGSLHCAVMCGPLMLSLPHQGEGFFKHFFSVLQYQLGRTLSYTFLGVIVGVIGNGAAAFMGQEIFGIGFGALLVLYALLYFSGNRLVRQEAFQQRLTAPLSALMGKIYRFRLWSLLAGMLNGLIPCGMVYLALASALNTGTVKESALFMFLFGCGTIPLMLFISLGGVYLKRYIRFNPTKLIPWFTLFLGALFILRSSNLNIPFLSPLHLHEYHTNAAECR